MKKLLLILTLAIVLGGCETQTARSSSRDFYSIEYSGVMYTASSMDYIDRIHDDELRATCWVVDGDRSGGISCIPDSQLTTPKATSRDDI